MAKIKKIGFDNLINIKKLMSVICSDNILNYRRIFFFSVPATFFQNLFYSVHLRKLTETYVVSDNNNVLRGLISVKAQKGNPYKWQIKRLFLANNSFEQGKQLIEYIIAKFGARGVDTFYVSVNDNQAELIDLFVKGCSFRSCSSESLWYVSNINFISDSVNEKDFKPFKNSDSKRCADFFNDNIISHYKYSLSKEKEEFNDSLFQGFNSDSNFKYLFEDELSHLLKAFIDIKTMDNKNYFIDIIIAPQFIDSYQYVLSFALKKILKRNKNFKVYIKNRLLQNNAILVKDFFKTVKNESTNMNNAIIFSGFEV